MYKYGIIVFVITMLAFMLLIIISLWLNRSSKQIGACGEKTVRKILKTLPNNQYKVFNNLILHTAHGTTQIDHVVVSQYGIFTIESKNYKGIITGNQNDRYWIQNINHTKDNKFYNPIKQNEGHKNALESALKIQDKNWIKPIVAFASTANVTVWADTPIVYFNELKNVILNHYTKILTEDDVVNICEKINQHNICSKKTEKEHIEYVKKQCK